MKNVVLSLYGAYPPASGCANVTFHFTKYLPGKRYLFQFCYQEGSLFKEGIIIKSFRLSTQGKIMKVLSLIKNLPGLYKDIAEIKPSNIFIEGASSVILLLCLFEYLKLRGIRSKFIYHAHNVEVELRKQKENCIIILLTRLAEKRMLRRSDLTTAVSDNDIKKFRSYYGISTHLLPNGVDIDKFLSIKKHEVDRIKKKYKLKGIILLFMGLPEYQPNREAIDFLDQKIMPELFLRRPDVRLSVIGGILNISRAWLINPGNIPFLEVPAFIKASDICLAPIFSGSGTRIKILEYLASEKPVISTRKGAEGLSLSAGQEIIYAESAEEFINQIIHLIKKRQIGKRLGKLGKKAVQAKFSWIALMRKFNKSLL